MTSTSARDVLEKWYIYNFSKIQSVINGTKNPKPVATFLLLVPVNNRPHCKAISYKNCILYQSNAYSLFHKSIRKINSIQCCLHDSTWNISITSHKNRNAEFFKRRKERILGFYAKCHDHVVSIYS